MSDDKKKPEGQSTFIDDLFSMGEEALGIVDSIKLEQDNKRVRQIEDEPYDPAVLPLLRGFLERNTGKRVTLVIEENEFRSSIGEGNMMRLGASPTLGGAIHRMCERDGYTLPTQRERPPLDNKSRAAGEKEED